ncbi:MAG: hypothetical protein K8J31_27575 [Anaerolineae bacterium]|nr:hypothetical protein [Anaerolineae bacterium]
MDNSLPSNEILAAYSEALPWETIEGQKERFNQEIRRLAMNHAGDVLDLEQLSQAVGAQVSTYFEPQNEHDAQIFLAEANGQQYILGSAVSKRYHSGKSLLDSITPYNLNPAVNHTNIHTTDDHTIRMRPLGAELELGLVHRDGGSPSEVEMQNFIRTYYDHAQGLGIYPRLDREACQYQIEAHIAPTIGYQKTRAALTGMMTALAAACEDTGLRTAILSAYPTLSDFKMSDDAKVQTAVDLMLDINNQFPEQAKRLEAARQRYHVTSNSHYVEMFRIQGCHIHLDLAGRSEALGLFTFYTMLRSATAIANATVLKGGPFVNGTCDPELLCVREHLRRTTVTGRYLDLPLSPHFAAGDMDQYATLLRTERVNAMARALLCNADTPGLPVSAMHNPMGRVRPELANSKRICTVESTGMPAHISVSRLAAVLTDFSLSHILIEHYFRRYGCDLGPMADDPQLWAILGPLDRATFTNLHDQGDRLGTDLTLRTAAGTEMRLSEFYEMKRRYMHRALSEIMDITPRDIDDVYTSLNRMLEPLSGKTAQTIDQFVSDPKLRSTGNWGQILKDTFVEAGGSPGSHNPDAVLHVVNSIHEAMKQRYLVQI